MPNEEAKVHRQNSNAIVSSMCVPQGLLSNMKFQTPPNIQLFLPYDSQFSFLSFQVVLGPVIPPSRHWASAGSIHDIDLPPDSQDPSCNKADSSSGIRQTSKRNQSPIGTIVDSEDLACNWQTCESSKGNYHPASCVISSVVLCLAHLANADRTEAQVTAAHKTKDDSEDDDHSRRLSSRKP